MTFEDYMQKMRDVGKEFGKSDVSTPFYNQANLHQLNWLGARESAENRAAKASLAQAGQEQDLGFRNLGGQKAGDEIYRRDIRQGQLQADQASAGAMVNLSQAEQAQADRVAQYKFQAAQAGAQYEAQREAQEKSAQLQREMQQVVMAGRALDRQHALAMNAANNAVQRERIAANTRAAANSLEVQKARIRAEIRMNQVRFGGGGGGVRMTSSVVSPGGSGNPNVHPSSRYAWA